MNEADLLNASTSYRLQSFGLEVDGTPLDFTRYPYLLELLDERCPRTTIIKGAQLGLTVACILRAIEDQLRLGLRGTGYFFPTDDEVADFSKARFDPILEQYGLASKVNTAGLKEVGSGYVWFRAAGQKGGGQKSLSKVKSFPADKIYLDEYDEMEPSRVDAARHRLDGAEPGVAEEVGLSTPTLPDFGVHYDYQQSDQRSWFWRCPSCNGWTCLEATWPDCVAEPAGKEPFYLCSKCRRELRKWTGDWVAAHPDKSPFHRGLYVSQLSSPRKQLGTIMREYEDMTRRGRLREFHNQVLARPYADIDDRLSEALLNECLDRDRPRALRSEGPCALGADIGVRDIHYVIGGRMNYRDALIYDYGVVASFEDLDQLAKRHNVVTGVLDIGAETRKVREFLDAHQNWWGCQYVNKRATGYDWNQRARVVTANRTEALDASHRAFVEKRDRLPAPDERYHELLVPQLLNLARTRIEDTATGTVTHRWVVVGGAKNDHLKHAHAYFRMALDQVPVLARVTRARQAGEDAAFLPAMRL